MTRANFVVVCYLAIGISACAIATPSWYPSEPRTERTGAYEYFLIATGSAAGEDQANACDDAAAGARATLTSLLVERNEARSEVVAACGGPSRVVSCLRGFAERALLTAPRTREVYDQAARRCYVELRWIEPRHLGAAARRGVEEEATEADVATEMTRALGTPTQEPSTPRPVQPTPTASPTANAAIEAAYPRWFIRLLPVPDCETHLVAFVGSPGGNEARWLELKRVETGWIVIDDQRITKDGWPSPPRVTWCD
jgi:hypothetical protein